MERNKIIVTLEESVVRAMDGSNSELFPYLPFILQDIWEIGADPATVISFIQKFFDSFQNLKVLDLGSGKGAVSIRVAAKLKCHCHGIDALPEFVAFSNKKAVEFQVDQLCLFEVGDIRLKLNSLPQYNIIILGAIGPVLGNYFETLTKLSHCLAPGGLIIIDDGYSIENSAISNSKVFKKSDILQQISDAGMILVDEEIVESCTYKDADDFILGSIKKRCFELINEYPTRANLFLNYIANQERETQMLRTDLICSTMAIRRL